MAGISQVNYQIGPRFSSILKFPAPKGPSPANKKLSELTCSDILAEVERRLIAKGLLRSDEAVYLKPQKQLEGPSSGRLPKKKVLPALA